MASSTPLLKDFWNKSLKTMPRKEVQKSLKEFGFTFALGSLSDDEMRKVLYGLLSQLGSQAQADTIHLLSER